MNICIITSRYPYKDNMEFVFVKKLVDEWALMGHHCYVITTDFSWVTYFRRRIQYKPTYYLDTVIEGNTVPVKVYNPRTLSVGGLTYKNISIDRWLAVKSLEKQINKLDVQFDFIYCHFFDAALTAFRYARRNKIQFFFATGESKIPELRKPYPGFCWEEFREYTGGVVAVSSKNKSEALEKNYIKADKCKVFPNATNLKIFKKLDRHEMRKRLNIPDDIFLVCCVGFFCERKGQNRVLEAIRKIGNPNIKIMFIGKAAKINGLELEGDEIIFKKSVENKELPLYLNACDVFCLPTRNEGCCNAVVEAMACGCAIVSSDKPFNYDVLNENNSILVDPDNIEQITSALLNLYNDKNLRDTLGENAMKESRRLGITERAKDIIVFIEEKKENERKA